MFCFFQGFKIVNTDENPEIVYVNTKDQLTRLEMKYLSGMESLKWKFALQNAANNARSWKYACQEQMYINEDKKHRHSMPSDKSFYDQINIEGIVYFFKFLGKFNSFVIRQKGESQNSGYKKTKCAKFSEKRTFLNP